MSQPKDNQNGSVNIGRHQAQCSICSSPYREQIEHEWINWTYPVQLEIRFRISRDALYRHAHAFDLFSKRRNNITLAIEKMIEKGDVAEVSGPAILSAIKLLVKLESEKHGEEGAPVTDAIESPKHKSPAEGENVAEGGPLPESLSGAEAATPDESQDGEKASQNTETNRLQ
jgi:hypothetical protein